MGKKRVNGQCPGGRAHHWIIDVYNHGVCINPGCKAERDFAGGPDYSHARAVSRKGGQARRRIAQFATPDITVFV